MQDVSEDMSSATEIPSAGLLSNGRYDVVVEFDGGGYSTLVDAPITPRFGTGTSVYVREPEATWSAGGVPDPSVSSEGALGPGCYRMRRVRDGLGVTSDISVVPDRDAELRRYTMRNGSERRRTFSLTCVTEIDASDSSSRRASREDPLQPSPAANSMDDERRQGSNGRNAAQTPEDARVRVEYLEDLSGMLAVRRLHDEADLYVLQAFLGEHEGVHEIEGDEVFGSRRAGEGPPEVDAKRTGMTESPRRPFMALRLEVTLDPGEERTATLIICAAHDRPSVLGTRERLSSDRALADASLEAALREQRTRDDLKLGPRHADRYHRLAADILRRNAGEPGQAASAALQRLGLDPFRPVALCRISDGSELKLARLMLKARTFWHTLGLDIQVLFLNDKSGTGADTIQHDLQALMELSASNTDDLVLRHADVVPPDDQAAIQKAAQLVVSSEKADLLQASG